MYVLYEIRNTVNEKRYIGCTQKWQDRKQEHIRTLSQNTHHNSYLQRAWNKYGSDKFIFSIIENVDTTEQMFNREIELIAENSNLYNIAKGGNGGDLITNHPNYKQIIENMKEARKNLYNDPIRGPIERAKRNSFQNLSEDEYTERCKLWSDVKKGPGNGRFKHDKKIAQIDKNTNEIVKIWEYSRLLDYNGFNSKYARWVAEGKPTFKSHKGYLWQYVEYID
jgi:group I intron endonuclease